MTTAPDKGKSFVPPARSNTRRAAPLEIALRQATALELGVPVVMRVNPRARRISLRLDSAGRTIALVLPRSTDAEAGLRFLAAQRGWIASRLAALPAAVPFADGAIVPLRGEPHRICRALDPAAPAVAIVDREIRVTGEPAYLARRVRDHLIALARHELSERARACAARLGRQVGRIGVRDTKSRWGSCSATGNLSFSWRLVFAPDAVIDYVVAHEVAHLAEMNHGPRFWRVVASLTPDSVGPRAWLRHHRLRLLSYG
ncbi:MAG TPA: SprT family zinc-dependent metalloprotease [Stellaceae bacterium]|nr:SprT family zinc-dependent metalloprotease [Stellaceae bacterium]